LASQFRQAIVEARDSAIEYAAFLKAKFKSVVDTIDGKRKETLNLMKEIGKATRGVNTAKFGAQQGAWVKRQVVMAERTVEHCNEHSGSIVGNHCMHFGSKGDQIMDAITNKMLPKLRDASNKAHLQNTTKAMKQILNLWYELMRTCYKSSCSRV